jgi:hypothetical protein
MMYRMYKCRGRHGEGESFFTGIARVERLAWATPGETKQESI